MNIILLGYNGYIGSYILKELVQQIKKNHNFKIICVGRNIQKKPFKSSKITYVKWDFLNFLKSKLFFFSKKNILINCIGKNSNNSKNLRETNLIFIQKLTKYINENKISAHFIHLGSVAVYSVEKEKLDRIGNITENSTIKSNDFYSKSKLEAELCIQNISKINKKHFSFTILRIANVFSELKNPNSFRLINFLLNKCVWFKCSAKTKYHYIHAKDIASAALLCILHLKKSRNKIYNVSDDINQLQLHKIYAMKHKVKLLIIPISLGILKLIIRYIPLPKMVFNFFLTISSQITYNNYKIKKELKFHSRYSLRNKF